MSPQWLTCSLPAGVFKAVTHSTLQAPDVELQCTLVYLVYFFGSMKLNLPAAVNHTQTVTPPRVNKYLLVLYIIFRNTANYMYDFK